jgi:hypothetical protein
MIVRALDVNGDWTFGKGKNNYLSGTPAIVQNISTRLNSYLGDCFFALDAGIDWFNLLGSKNQIALELAVRKVIMSTDGVVRLVDASFDLDHTTRRITMRYTVETIYTVANRTPPVTNLSSYLLTQDGFILTTEDGDPLVAG